MANLLVEIGNTALKAARTEENVLGKTYRYQGEKMMEFIVSLTARETPEVMTVSAVRVLSEEEIALLEGCCAHLLVLDAAHPETLASYGLPGYLSYDRAAAIIAARYLFKGKGCSVFDFGNTITIDFIAPDGSYQGGSISPGCRTRFKALNRYAKSLPLVNTPEEVRPAGDSLKSDMETGVIVGIKFEIEGYMARNPENVVVFTGGDAIYFAKMMKNSIFAVCNLVLMGLLQITNEYVRKSGK